MAKGRELELEIESASELSNLSNSGQSMRSSALSMGYSSSPFEGNSSSDESLHMLDPYLYEPEESSDRSGSSSNSSSDDESQQERLSNTNW